MADLYQLATSFGPSIGVILFFLGRDAAREERMSKEIDKLNNFIQGELIALIKHDETNK